MTRALLYMNLKPAILLHQVTTAAATAASEAHSISETIEELLFFLFFFSSFRRSRLRLQSLLRSSRRRWSSLFFIRSILDQTSFKAQGARHEIPGGEQVAALGIEVPAILVISRR